MSFFKPPPPPTEPIGGAEGAPEELVPITVADRLARSVQGIQAIVNRYSASGGVPAANTRNGVDNKGDFGLFPGENPSEGEELGIGENAPLLPRITEPEILVPNVSDEESKPFLRRRGVQPTPTPPQPTDLVDVDLTPPPARPLQPVGGRDWKAIIGGIAAGIVGGVVGAETVPPDQYAPPANPGQNPDIPYQPPPPEPVGPAPPLPPPTPVVPSPPVPVPPVVTPVDADMGTIPVQPANGGADDSDEDMPDAHPVLVRQVAMHQMRNSSAPFFAGTAVGALLATMLL